jgi:hypothetical protein
VPPDAQMKDRQGTRRPASQAPTNPRHAGAALQATVAAAIEAVEGATARIRLAEDAALSLAQRERLAGVASDLEATAEGLRPRLDPKASCLLIQGEGWTSRLRSRLLRAPAPPAAPLWADALADAFQALEEAEARMMTLGRGTPAAADAARVARAVARRLRKNRDVLLLGADRWRLAA